MFNHFLYSFFYYQEIFLSQILRHAMINEFIRITLTSLMRFPNQFSLKLVQILPFLRLFQEFFPTHRFNHDCRHSFFDGSEILASLITDRADHQAYSGSELWIPSISAFDVFLHFLGAGDIIWGIVFGVYNEPKSLILIF